MVLCDYCKCSCMYGGVMSVVYGSVVVVVAVAVVSVT